MPKFALSNPLERLQAFTEILKAPDQDSINLALEAYESLPGGPGRFSELKTLAFAWGQVNPQVALAWAKKQQHWDEHVATGSILDSWVRNDADAAIGWANENFEGEDNPYYVGLVKGLSEVSLPKATDLMTELPTEEFEVVRLIFFSRRLGVWEKIWRFTGRKISPKAPCKTLLMVNWRKGCRRRYG